MLAHKVTIKICTSRLVPPLHLKPALSHKGPFAEQIHCLTSMTPHISIHSEAIYTKVSHCPQKVVTWGSTASANFPKFWLLPLCIKISQQLQAHQVEATKYCFMVKNTTIKRIKGQPAV